MQLLTSGAYRKYWPQKGCAANNSVLLLVSESKKFNAEIERLNDGISTFRKIRFEGQ